MTNEERREAIDAIVLRLIELGDAVQVHVSWHEADGDTVGYHSGRGDWYARRGLAQEFIETDNARTVAKEISDAQAT